MNARAGRLKSAEAKWLKLYTGSNHIDDYRRHFGVNAGAAIVELRLLGVQLTEEAIRNAKQAEENAIKAKQARKANRLRRQQERREMEMETPWLNEEYAYIAGYTGWGFPYGITWAEMEQYADHDSLDATVPPKNRQRNSRNEEGWPFAEGNGTEEEAFASWLTDD